MVGRAGLPARLRVAQQVEEPHLAIVTTRAPPPRATPNGADTDGIRTGRDGVERSAELKSDSAARSRRGPRAGSGVGVQHMPPPRLGIVRRSPYSSSRAPVSLPRSPAPSAARCLNVALDCPRERDGRLCRSGQGIAPRRSSRRPRPCSPRHQAAYTADRDRIAVWPRRLSRRALEPRAGGRGIRLMTVPTGTSNSRGRLLVRVAADVDGDNGLAVAVGQRSDGGQDRTGVMQVRGPVGRRDGFSFDRLRHRGRREAARFPADAIDVSVAQGAGEV